MIDERYQLSKERILAIKEDQVLKGAYADYFYKTADFIAFITETLEWIYYGGLQKETQTILQERNQALYEDILPKQYETSYANPAYAVAQLGEEYGQLLSCLYAELRSMIAYAYEQDLFSIIIRMELFLEIYSCFLYSREEGTDLPSPKEVKDAIYWFASDYSEEMMEEKVRNSFDPSICFATKLVMDSDLDDLRYLYGYGEYIAENEVKMAEYLMRLPQEDIKKMADTYTEGYRIGFEVAQKDLKKKKTVNVRYFIGFERVVRQAILNFREMGLEPVIYRAPVSFFNGRVLNKSGYFGAIANEQFEYDHEYDRALFFDKQFMNRRLESYQASLEKHKELAAVFAGPAVIERFGEKSFVPKSKKEALQFTPLQQQLQVEFQAAAGNLLNQYVKGEERSFTIIAFPVPEIGPKFEQIFDEVMRINTLDYKLYEGIQKLIIDVLDQAEYVRIKGTNGNRTDLSVALQPLKDPEKETKFENCVADVNIPLGEVFTSPKLEHTNGTLHVTKVFLNGLEFLDLELTFKDGMIEQYRCGNFETEEENRKYIKDHILFHHDTLPIGEFAIGTNTTAYMAAEKYQIADKLPILIAEKTGPHFAVGDTCFYHEEDLPTYNPDGKQIIAKENEKSAIRKTDESKAYYMCHTDITIPYHEVGEITAVSADGKPYEIIKNGRYILKGCEELNKAFDE